MDYGTSVCVQDVMSAEGLGKMIQFLETDPLLVFDYDGTLCPIVKHHEEALLSARTRELLRKLCDKGTCAVLTGRSRADILPRLQGLALAQVVGSHGSDWPEARPGDEGIRVRVEGWRRELEHLLKGLDGVKIEDKGLSLSIHYRMAEDHELAIKRITEALVALHDARAIGGKEVFNVLPHECSGKGQALVALKLALGKRTALFVGDDLTDEEVFELPPSEGVFKIRVGELAGSRADYILRSQADMESLLELLLKHLERKAC
jgi:trehalose 6-phosphate phosphatase